MHGSRLYFCCPGGRGQQGVGSDSAPTSCVSKTDQTKTEDREHSRFGDSGRARSFSDTRDTREGDIHRAAHRINAAGRAGEEAPVAVTDDQILGEEPIAFLFVTVPGICDTGKRAKAKHDVAVAVIEEAGPLRGERSEGSGQVRDRDAGVIGICG